jgi:hypothetical protein
MSLLAEPERWYWYWHRLRAMAPAEVAGRVLEKVRRSADRAAAHTLGDFYLSDPEHRWPALPVPHEAPERVRRAIANDARAIRTGRWLLFGWNEAQVTDPPAWHRDLVRGIDTPTRVAARHLDHRRLAGAADARCVWEINRWAEIVRLAQNAWLNGSLDDARVAQRWLRDWCDENPLGVGINWCSPLEAGLRLVNFCWIDALVRGCECSSLTAVQDALSRVIVPGHAWWVWRHRSFGSSANNHLLGELAGLTLAARRWPSISGIACSAERAWQLMSVEVLRQFAEDGGNREQALHYHQFAWETAWQAYRVMDSGPGPVGERLRAAARFFCDLAHETEPWDFGDSDDAQVTPLPAERHTALAEWRAWLLARPEGEALQFWLGNPPGNVCRPKSGTWRSYPQSGLAVLEVNGWKVRVDGSPLGLGSMAAHGHLDAMHVSMWDGEHAVVIDPGTGVYAGDPQIRDKLTSWEWHNGPVPMGGRPRPQRAGRFLWADHHAAPRIAVADGACKVELAADGGVLTRTVEYLAAADAWRLTDIVAGDLRYVVRWRLAPTWRAVSQSWGQVLVARASGALRLRVESENGVGLHVSQDLVSRRYGEMEQGLVITVTFTKRLVSQWHRLPDA